VDSYVGFIFLMHMKTVEHVHILSLSAMTGIK